MEIGVFAEYLRAEQRISEGRLRPITWSQYWAMSQAVRDSYQREALAYGWLTPRNDEPRTLDEQYVEDGEDWTKPNPNTRGM